MFAFKPAAKGKKSAKPTKRAAAKPAGLQPSKAISKSALGATTRPAPVRTQTQPTPPAASTAAAAAAAGDPNGFFGGAPAASTDIAGRPRATARRVSFGAGQQLQEFEGDEPAQHQPAQHQQQDDDYGYEPPQQQEDLDEYGQYEEQPQQYGQPEYDEGGGGEHEYDKGGEQLEEEEEEYLKEPVENGERGDAGIDEQADEQAVAPRDQDEAAQAAEAAQDAIEKLYEQRDAMQDHLEHIDGNLNECCPDKPDNTLPTIGLDASDDMNSVIKMYLLAKGTDFTDMKGFIPKPLTPQKRFSGSSAAAGGGGGLVPRRTRPQLHKTLAAAN